MSLPAQCAVQTLATPAIDMNSTDDQAILSALENPFGKRLEHIIRDCLVKTPNPSVAIAISDQTRGVPRSVILSALLNNLEAAGISRQRVSILIGGGSHRRPTPEETALLADTRVTRGAKVIAHRAGETECAYVGTTSRGTPVRLNTSYVEADLKIITGAIEAHQLCGYSGGAKSVIIGLGDEETITRNHSHLTEPMSAMDVFDGNPIREDIEEAFRFASADYMLNVVLDESKRILRAFAGTYPEAYLEGVKFAGDTFHVGFDEQCDLVLVSCGGYPKDINVYQAQKALAHVERLVKPGGIVILFAQCPDGAGHDLFVEWMETAKSLDDVSDRLEREGFKLGAHKAFLLARNLARTRTFLVSDLDAGLARRLFFTPFSNSQEAVDEALKVLSGNGTSNPLIAVVPRGTGILPVIQGEHSAT